MTTLARRASEGNRFRVRGWLGKTRHRRELWRGHDRVAPNGARAGAPLGAGRWAVSVAGAEGGPSPAPPAPPAFGTRPATIAVS